jgi:hypothetical protein
VLPAVLRTVAAVRRAVPLAVAVLRVALRLAVALRVAAPLAVVLRLAALPAVAAVVQPERAATRGVDRSRDLRGVGAQARPRGAASAGRSAAGPQVRTVAAVCREQVVQWVLEPGRDVAAPARPEPAGAVAHSVRVVPWAQAALRLRVAARVAQRAASLLRAAVQAVPREASRLRVVEQAVLLLAALLLLAAEPAARAVLREVARLQVAVLREALEAARPRAVAPAALLRAPGALPAVLLPAAERRQEAPAR